MTIKEFILESEISSYSPDQIQLAQLYAEAEVATELLRCYSKFSIIQESGVDPTDMGIFIMEADEAVIDVEYEAVIDDEYEDADENEDGKKKGFHPGSAIKNAASKAGSGIKKAPGMIAKKAKEAPAVAKNWWEKLVALIKGLIHSVYKFFNTKSLSSLSKSLGKIENQEETFQTKMNVKGNKELYTKIVKSTRFFIDLLNDFDMLTIQPRELKYLQNSTETLKSALDVDEKTDTERTYRIRDLKNLVDYMINNKDLLDTLEKAYKKINEELKGNKQLEVYNENIINTFHDTYKVLAKGLTKITKDLQFITSIAARAAQKEVKANSKKD